MLSVHEPIILALSTERTETLVFLCFVQQQYTAGRRRNTFIFKMRFCDFGRTDLCFLQEQIIAVYLIMSQYHPVWNHKIFIWHLIKFIMQKYVWNTFFRHELNLY
jgi:hypothetical protein